MSGHRVEAAAAAVAKAGKDGGRTSVAAVEFDVVTDFLVQLASAVCLPLALCSPLGLLALQSSASHFTSKFFGVSGSNSAQMHSSAFGNELLFEE